MAFVDLFIESHGLRRLATSREGVTLGLLDVAPATPRPERLLDVLSLEERARADRFRSLEDRLRFGLTRAALRLILAEATGEAPEDLLFETGPYGKPRLAGRGGPFFNVSHSGDYALVGLAQVRPIGVDIECARASLDVLDLAGSFFSPREYRLLAGLDATVRESAFYTIWTGKEAVLKALGIGIAEHLRDFSVLPNDPRLDITADAAGLAPRLVGMVVEPIEVPSGYAAALALA